MTGTLVPAMDVYAHMAVPPGDALIEGRPGPARQRQMDATTPGPASPAGNPRRMSAAAIRGGDAVRLRGPLPSVSPS
ncbi:hypothetical protein ABZX77_24065 [Streptomyces sp. NPDC004237]|uniref:hypothetical protein n=1 Tax=Streptomyces sp. NPDC004237 TaxID=3154455 RepID=UPI0033BB7B3E